MTSSTKTTNAKCKTSRKQKKGKFKCVYCWCFSTLFFSLIFPGVRLAADSQFSDFLDGLGPAQLVGRQTLATPSMGKHLYPVDII